MNIVSISLIGQTTEKTYYVKGVSNGPTYCYQVTELIIKPNSEYELNSYGCGDKKRWKEYKKWKSEKSSGKITKSGEYYTLTEYRNGNKTDLSWNCKIKNKAVIFYLDIGNGKMRRTTKYKRTSW